MDYEKIVKTIIDPIVEDSDSVLLRVNEEEKDVLIIIAAEKDDTARLIGRKGLIANAILRPFIVNYNSRKASWPLVILQIIASIFAVSIGFMKSTLTVSLATILFLVFNSSALPLLQGILISCVDNDLGATGFAIANILTQVLTSGTTPLLYGIINDKYKEKYPSLAMICIMSLQFIAVPFLIALAILRNKKFDDEEKRKKEEQGEELIEK